MAKKYKSKCWTETYHSWQEYEERNPDWDKHPSSRIAAGFARIELEKNGVYTAHCFTLPSDAVHHRDVSNFLKKLDEAEKSARNSNLRFKCRCSRFLEFSAV